MKKIWKTWKPRKKEKEGNQELHFIQHPENEIQYACICARGSCAVYCASTGPHSRPEHLLILYHDNMFNL